MYYATDVGNVRTKRQSVVFIAWVAVGACAAVAVLTPFTIGLLCGLVAVVGASALLISPRGRTPAALGILCGAGLIPLYVAWLNRKGPGNICTATSSSCVQEWNPWFWFALGIVLIAVGIVTFILLSKKQTR